MIDNYDSFTFNLVQLVKDNSTFEIDVFRNDEIDLSDIDSYDKIILSPGPGLPKDAGIMNQIIERYKNEKSIFGVCLGMQAIGEVFGSTLYNLNEPFHGISTTISHNSEKILKGIPSNFNVGRYHSWALDCGSIPDILSITAVDSNGIVMAIEHKELRISGVQFHPESILTEYGKVIITNFLFN